MMSPGKFLKKGGLEVFQSISHFEGSLRHGRVNHLLIKLPKTRERKAGLLNRKRNMGIKNKESWISLGEDFYD